MNTVRTMPCLAGSTDECLSLSPLEDLLRPVFDYHLFPNLAFLPFCPFVFPDHYLLMWCLINWYTVCKCRWTSLTNLEWVGLPTLRHGMLLNTCMCWFFFQAWYIDCNPLLCLNVRTSFCNRQHSEEADARYVISSWNVTNYWSRLVYKSFVTKTTIDEVNSVCAKSNFPGPYFGQILISFSFGNHYHQTFSIYIIHCYVNLIVHLFIHCH